MATPKKQLGHRTAMSDRLLKLAAETNDPQPYPVTAEITVYPPTRTRQKAMNAAEAQLYLLGTLQAQAFKRTAQPRPVIPEDATDEQVAEHAAALANWQAEADGIEALTSGIRDKIAAATADYERAFFGDAHDAVMHYFEDKPLLWDLFIPDIKAEFLPPAPDNGACPTCGHIEDEEAAASAPKSLNTSTDTGMTSKET